MTIDKPEKIEAYHIEGWLDVFDISQTEFATLVGTSQPSMSAMMSGARPISQKMEARLWAAVQKLARADLSKDTSEKCVVALTLEAREALKDLTGKAGVYSFWVDHACVYVGRSADLASRIPSSAFCQREDGEQFELRVIVTASVWDAAVLEIALIHALRPARNKEFATWDGALSLEVLPLPAWQPIVSELFSVRPERLTAEQLKELLEEHDLSTAELAEVVGTSQPAVAAMCSGKRNITAKMTRRIYEGLEWYLAPHSEEDRAAMAAWYEKAKKEGLFDDLDD